MRPLPSEVSPTARGIGDALSPRRFVCHFACSLRASSLFSRVKRVKREAKPQGAAFRVSARVFLARPLFKISPKWRACSQAILNDFVVFRHRRDATHFFDWATGIPIINASWTKWLSFFSSHGQS